MAYPLNDVLNRITKTFKCIMCGHIMYFKKKVKKSG